MDLCMRRNEKLHKIAIKILNIFAAPFIIFVFIANANALDLGMPIACNYGKDCFISNYFDHDVAKDFYKDRSCGGMSRDGYKSTDFILKNVPQMKQGVSVLAGDNGVVKAVRNNVADVNVEMSGIEAVRGRECGNGLIIEHKRGYETQYCHLKKDSIILKRGDKVDKGQIIGEVGLSGMTSFPFLEFTVSLDNKPIDPFTAEDPITGSADIACDSPDAYPLWDKQTEKTLIYINTAVLNAGFSSKVPNAIGAREGHYSAITIPNSARVMSFWVDILGVIKGDTLKMSIISPAGEEIYSNTKVFTSDKRHLFQFIGKKLESGKKAWDEGEYIGRAVLLRETGGVTTKTVFDNKTIVIVTAPKAPGS
jgi:hypothetical protein